MSPLINRRSITGTGKPALITTDYLANNAGRVDRRLGSANVIKEKKKAYKENCKKAATASHPFVGGVTDFYT